MEHKKQSIYFARVCIALNASWHSALARRGGFDRDEEGKKNEDSLSGEEQSILCPVDAEDDDNVVRPALHGPDLAERY